MYKNEFEKNFPPPSSVSWSESEQEYFPIITIDDDPSEALKGIVYMEQWKAWKEAINTIINSEEKAWMCESKDGNIDVTGSEDAMETYKRLGRKITPLIEKLDGEDQW